MFNLNCLFVMIEPMTLDDIQELLNRRNNSDVEINPAEYKEALIAANDHLQKMLNILDDNIGRDDDPYGVLKDLQHEYVSYLYSR